MKRIGRKTKEWILNKQKLLSDLPEGLSVRDGLVFGNCLDCGTLTVLTPDHKRKRSLGGSDEKKNIDWVCIRCHTERDQMGDRMEKKQDPDKLKKADWQKEHRCKCGISTRMLICSSCGRLYDGQKKK